MAKTITIVNQKGGVGKTTTTFNLGACLAQAGKKVLLVDMDQQGNLTYCMGHESPDEVKATIAQLMLQYIAIDEEECRIDDYIFHRHIGDISLDYMTCNVEMASVETALVNAMQREQILKLILEEVKSRYDYILLDCGPSLGLTTMNALVAADSALIPLKAEKLSSLGMELLLKNIMRVKRRLNPSLDIEGILFCAVNKNYKEDIKTVHEVKERFESAINVYDFVVPSLTHVSHSIRDQQPLIVFSESGIRRGESQVADIYNQLAQEVIENE